MYTNAVKLQTTILQHPLVPQIMNRLWSVVNLVRGDHLVTDRNRDALYCDSDSNRPIISLTTNPRRIRSLLNRLLPLLPQADIHINLPYRQKNEEEYPQECIQELESQGILVFWYPLDKGPCMKLLPTLYRVWDMQPRRDIVLSIDDDVILGSEMVSVQKNFFAKEGPCIASRQVQSQEGMPQILGVNVIGLHTSLLSQEFLQDLEAMNQMKECLLHDDMALCMAVRKHKWPVKESPQFFHKLHSESFTVDSLWHRDPHSIKDHECQAALSAFESTRSISR